MTLFSFWPFIDGYAEQWLDCTQLGESAKRRCPDTSGCSSTTTSSDNVVAELSKRVETLYPILDRMFLESDIAELDAETRGGSVKTDKDGQVVLEVVDCTAMPFDVPTVGNAMWKIFCTPKMQFGDGVYEVRSYRP